MGLGKDLTYFVLGFAVLEAVTWGMGYFDRKELINLGERYTITVNKGDVLSKYVWDIKRCPNVRASVDPGDVLSVIQEINRIENPDRIFAGSSLDLLSFDGCPNT